MGFPVNDEEDMLPLQKCPPGALFAWWVEWLDRKLKKFVRWLGE